MSGANGMVDTAIPAVKVVNRKLEEVEVKYRVLGKYVMKQKGKCYDAVHYILFTPTKTKENDKS